MNNTKMNHPPRMHGGHPAGNGARANDFAGSWKNLIAYGKKYLPAVIIALICAASGTVIALLGPNKISDITNLILEGIKTGIDLNGVIDICILLAILYAISVILSIIQGQIMAIVTQRFSKRLRTDISEKINRLPMSYYNRTSVGDVLSRVTNDVDTIGQSLNQSLGNLVTAGAQLIGSVIMMFITSGTMALTAILSSVLGFVFMTLIMKKSQKYFTMQQESLGRINGHIEEVYAGHTIVKAYNGEQQEKKAFTEMNDALRKSAFKAQCLSGLMTPFMNFIGNFGYVAVCIVGAVLVSNKVIDFGVIVAFMIYVRLFTQPLSQISQAMQTLQSAAAAGERVFGFLEEEEMADESKKTKKLNDSIHGDVDFEHVSFGYEDSDITVIKDFSVSVKAGQKQQLTIARAMIADRPILILDEATSSIDTRTELRIQRAMDILMKDRTSFVIAHRLSTIKNADLILVLNNGDIVESGTHDELLSRNGFYAKLYNSQFEKSAS